MTMDGLLPPYTPEERGRELCMSSKALCWRARRAHAQSRRLRDESEALRLKFRRMVTQTTLLPTKQALFVTRHTGLAEGLDNTDYCDPPK